MRLPKQAKPVMRKAVHSGQTSNIRPSGCGCGGNECCIGPCVFGNCLGACVPWIPGVPCPLG